VVAIDVEAAEVVLAIRIVVVAEVRKGGDLAQDDRLSLGSAAIAEVIKTLPPVKVDRNASLRSAMRLARSLCRVIPSSCSIPTAELFSGRIAGGRRGTGRKDRGPA
jgi:hypothetical protein